MLKPFFFSLALPSTSSSPVSAAADHKVNLLISLFLFLFIYLFIYLILFLFFIDGYTTDDVIYLWKYGNEKSVEVHDGVMMSQFDLKTVTTDNHTRRTAIGNVCIYAVWFLQS